MASGRAPHETHLTMLEHHRGGQLPPRERIAELVVGVVLIIAKEGHRIYPHTQTQRVRTPLLGIAGKEYGDRG